MIVEVQNVLVSSIQHPPPVVKESAAVSGSTADGDSPEAGPGVRALPPMGSRGEGGGEGRDS